MSIYQIGFLGASNPDLRAKVARALMDRLPDLGLEMDSDVEIVDSVAELLKFSTASKVALYFGNVGAKDSAELVRLVDSALPVLPVAPGKAIFNDEIPPCLQHFSGLLVHPDEEHAMLRVSTCILECLGLLRTQRQVFVSYRRAESRNAAIQLHESLSARQFDVYLDTHDVRPAEDFQEQLWHRLSDCDVLVMLDTPGYFASRWTYEEFGRAQAKFLAILRVGWPGHPASAVLRLGEDLQLSAGDLDSASRLMSSAMQRIVCAVERLRAKSIAVRHAGLASAFMDAVAFNGGQVHGVGIDRTISATLKNGREVVGIPAVGIPTSETLYRAALSPSRSHDTEAAIIYDHVGLHPQYVEHLKWLHKYVKDVRWVWQANATTDLARW